MQIRALHLHHFRSHIDTRLTLAPLTVIRGTNAAGKSSIEQALEIALASRADGTTADGKGSSALVRAGNNKALIAVEMRDVDDSDQTRLLKCALSDGRRACVVSDPTNPQWAGSSDFLDSLTVHREILSCLINNRRFVDLPADEQRTVLAAIILPRFYTWPEWVVPAATTCGISVNWSRTPFEIVTDAYDRAFKERTNVNRDLKNFRLPEGDTSAATKLSEYTTRLAAVNGELESAVAALASQRSSAESTAATRRQAQTRLDEATRRLQREEQTVAGLEANLLSAARLKELEKVAKGRAAASRLEADLVEVEAQLSAAKATVEQLNTFSNQPACPTCGSAITPELVAALATPAVAEKNRLFELRQSTIDARKKLGNPEEASSLIKAHNQALSDREAGTRRAAEDRVVIADAQAKLDELGIPFNADYSAQEAAIADLRTRVQKGTEAIAIARAAHDLKERIAAAEQHRTALQGRQRELEKLVTYFGDGPEGVKAELLSGSVGPFVEAMNRVLISWGYTCQIVMDPYAFSLAFTDRESSYPISVKHLSKSQRYRFAAAFQVALAIFSGYRFLCIDEADIYDADGRAGLYETLQAHLLSGDLDQVILLSTDEREAVPPVNNAVFYRFDDIAESGYIATTQVRQLIPAVAKAA